MTTLVILAAGLGSRFGSDKQLENIHNGNALFDYAIYDALEAGFDNIVLIIRHAIDDLARQHLENRFAGVPITYVYQDDFNPKGIERKKPWGTGHALLCLKDQIHNPFLIINADDFYGRHGFAALADKLRSFSDSHDKYCMVGYRVGNTLSESGSVARGVCEVDANGFLTGVVERTAIARDEEGKIAFTDEHGQKVILDENTPVSMNMWGFTPDYFEHSERLFRHFLSSVETNPKFEYYIPLVVNHLVAEGTSTVEVLDTPDSWFGVTYAEDRPGVVAKLAALAEDGAYPEKLFS